MGSMGFTVMAAPAQMDPQTTRERITDSVATPRRNLVRVRFWTAMAAADARYNSDLVPAL